jgi:threonylcarbamoyladenosine tRNA methylthiotransferase MtaB
VERRHPLRLATTTLGCKVNRADADALITGLVDPARIVVVPFEADADVYIINTCTVTATADRQSRQMIYRARRRNPRSKVVVTGCLARVDRSLAEGILGVDRVFALAEHGALAEYVRAEALMERCGVGSPSTAAGASSVEPRARPFLKIQDGCDGHCSYCIVPRARGASRSDPPATVRSAVGELARGGYAEIVLTGIHLGLYGRDLDPPTSLAALLAELAQAGPRLRLSSVEPMELDELLVGQVASRGDVVCPHLHVPLQSGSSEILAAMNRPYDGERAIEILDWIHRRLPLAALGTDLITGFPGETAAQHQRSLSLVEESPLTHLHVFPFSARPGTAAAALPGRIDDGELRRRAAALREAGRRKLVAFAARQVGEVRAMIVERVRDRVLCGLTERYLRVEAAGEAAVGQIARVKIEAAAGPLLRGRVVD